MKNRAPSSPPAVYARIAGLAYLLVIVLGVVSATIIDSSLLVEGDRPATARNIVANELLFRISIVGTLVLYAGVLVLSWALYVVLKPVNAKLSLLALVFRSAEGVLGAATAFFSLIVLASVESELDHGTQTSIAVLLNARTAALDIVLLFVGIGGAVFCYLLFVSRLIPRILAGWGIATYVSMFGLAVLSILWPAHPSVIEFALYGAGTVFEICIGLWLLIKAIDVPKWEALAAGTA